MAGRTPIEKLTDHLLLLYLMDDASKRIFLKRTRLQKLVFLSEWAMLDARHKGFDYNFIRLKFGPFSSELEKDLSHFAETEIVGNLETIMLNKLGRIILRDFGHVFERNTSFVEKILDVNEKYARLRLDKLLKIVYSMPSPIHRRKRRGRPRVIGRMIQTTPLLKRIPRELASKVFSLTPEEVATLEIYFDKEGLVSLIKANKSAKEKPLLVFNEVF